jgi:glycine cleavage system H protein
MSSEYLETTIDKFVLRVRKDLRYTEEHTWVRKEGGTHSLGLTDYAQTKGGDVVFLEFKDDTGVIKAGQLVALYETIKAALDLKAPFDCEIIELNRVLEGEPELVNTDPYGAGWVARVRPVGPETFDELLSPEKYLEFMLKAEAQAS